jgi:hypothetical protein
LKPLLLAGLLAFAGAAHAQMYKCVDEKGVTRYTDTPCPGGKGKQVDVRPTPRSSAGPAGPMSDFARRELEARDQDIARKRALERARNSPEGRCELLRQDQVRLSTGDAVTIRKPTGERVRLDDATRKRRLAEIEKELKKCK